MNTPVTRVLESHAVAYHLLPHTEAVVTVEAAARKRGVAVETMVKSILLHTIDRQEPTHVNIST